MFARPFYLETQKYPQIGVTKYVIVAPSQWIYSTDVAFEGGLVRFCERLHRRNLQLSKQATPVGVGSHDYWVEILRVPDTAWETYQRALRPDWGRWHPERLNVYAGTVWDSFTSQTIDDIQDLARESDPCGNRFPLYAEIRLSQTRLSHGAHLKVDLSVSNRTERQVFIPPFEPQPFRLVAVNILTGSFTEPIVTERGTDYCPSGNNPGVVLGPLEKWHMELSYIVDGNYPAPSWDLEPAEYRITIADLARFGYPTLCRPVNLRVEEASEPSRE